ncbi:lipoyl(octanoyl) transferase LipB [Candidatus Poribacteria bacterium]|nr:lipoyl(octanoyl) transferase LipB [Candidatus Poribacteria bacterium]
MGIVDYKSAHNMQKQLLNRHLNDGRNSLILLQHKPVITVGRSGHEDNILVSESMLKSSGIEIYEVERGGDVTYHGPGQLTGYPIIDLKQFKKDVHWYLRQLEQVIIDVLAQYGIEGKRIDAYTGVWVGNEKVAAIGVAVRRWITYHGFALNIHPDMSHFKMITPCGITDKGVTSLEKLLGYKIDLNEVMDKTISVFGKIFKVKPIHTRINPTLPG